MYLSLKKGIYNDKCPHVWYILNEIDLVQRVTMTKLCFVLEQEILETHYRTFPLQNFPYSKLSN